MWDPTRVSNRKEHPLAKFDHLLSFPSVSQYGNGEGTEFSPNNGVIRKVTDVATGGGLSDVVSLSIARSRDAVILF